MTKENNNKSSIQKKANKFVDSYIEKHWKDMITDALKRGHSLI